MAEVDLAPGELGVDEIDRAAGELDFPEVAPVEDDTCEVEVQALPGRGSFFLEMGGYDADNGVARLTDGLEGKSLRLGSVRARIGFIWHP